MVLKTPVIAVASRGPQEFIKTGVNGYLVENDVEEIVDIIMMLYADVNLRSLIANNAAKNVQQFGNEEVMKKIREVLE